RLYLTMDHAMKLEIDRIHLIRCTLATTFFLITMKEILFSTLKIIAGVYAVICVLLFFFQEKLIFFPEKLDKDFDFNFDQNFEEVNLKTRDNKLLHGIL